ncbi:thymidine phosphorylase [Opitutales bacterium]|nr:thymidine phosphorylase [bacterium]MDA7756485.1 thymidine phosphorylase [Opitutales bacterium]MDA8991646.1 thymidine phosphorylase [Opitutales bacterium]
MNIPFILAKVRDQIPLSRNELKIISDGLANGSVSDAQAAAFAMAVCLTGLSENERVGLTLAMRDSGNVQEWDLPGPVIDKHSTGGIGDNVSLVLAPMLAACGGYVPMISGRGLGHTGGTLDKLEAIPGYRTQVTSDDCTRIVKEVGCAIVGAGEGIAPADKRLYSIRDITGTVESIDLITSSILSKKLAAGLEALVLDVKVGSGAFMKDVGQARELARSLVSVANGAGCRTTALLTDMNEPLADSAGNALEVKSALIVLKNEPGEERLLEVTLRLGSYLLVTADLVKDAQEGRELLVNSLSSGKAAEIFGRMVSALGGPTDFVERYDEYLPKAKKWVEFTSPESGFLESVDGRLLGQAIIEMGGGRTKADDTLNFSVGFDRFLRIGQKISKGDALLRIHSSNDRDIERAQVLLSKAFGYSQNTINSKPLIIETISKNS